MKNLFFTGVLALATAQVGFAQNNPTIDALYLSDTDPFCYNGTSKTLTVVITDLDGDVVICDPPVFLNNYLVTSNGTAPVVVGNTSTFEFVISMNYGPPPPAGVLSTDNITVIANSLGSDPSPTVSADLNSVGVNGQIAVDFTTGLLEVCSNGLPINLNDYVVVPGGTFNYATDAGFNNFSSSPALNLATAYNVYINNDYSFNVSYELTDVNGCSNYSLLNVSFFDAPNAVMTTVPSTCLSATGGATLTLSGSGPFDVTWTNGVAESGVWSSTISNISSGVYYVNVVDANGCKAKVKADVSDSDITVVPALTPARCAGQPGNVVLSITPTTGVVSSIHWSNGSTGSTLSSGPGEYAVDIHTSANCNFFGTYPIQDSTLKVKLESVYNNNNCALPDGGIDITTIGGNGPYSWDWKKDGVSVYTTEDIWSIDGGAYTCTVQDNSGCSLTWGKTVTTYNNVYLWTNNVINPTCGSANGSIDVYVDPAYDTPSIYSWSNGAVTEDLTGVPTGNYTLTYADQSGCISYLTVKLENEKPYQPSICLLTVDDALGYNMVVWEKDLSQTVSGFNIYRESASSLGIFEKVATRDFALESFYQDNDASPMDCSWRYYLTTYDACGGESYGSFIHKTIHVIATTSNGTDFTMKWDNYEGINYTSIDLHRYDATNGWVIVANLPFGTNTHNDTPPVIAGLDYLVTFNLADPCTSTKVQDHNSSRSNKSASVFMPGGSTAAIQDTELGYISIYPNPASELITLHVDKPELFQNYEVRDLNGRLVSSGAIFSNKTNIALDELAPGLYVIQLFADNKIITEKFIKD